MWSIFPASSTAKAGRKQRKPRKQGTMEAGLEPAGTGYEPAVEPSTILKTVAVGAFSGSSHKGVRKLAASSVLSACRYKVPFRSGFFLEKKLRTLPASRKSSQNYSYFGGENGSPGAPAPTRENGASAQNGGENTILCIDQELQSCYNDLH